jgi:hypothetical protein
MKERPQSLKNLLEARMSVDREQVFVVVKNGNRVLYFDDVEDEFGVAIPDGDGVMREWGLRSAGPGVTGSRRRPARKLVGTSPVSAFYKGESQEKKQPRRLEGAKMFAALSSPCHVERLWGIRSSQIHSVFVTALSDSEVGQAAGLNVVNHSSI